MIPRPLAGESAHCDPAPRKLHRDFPALRCDPSGVTNYGNSNSACMRIVMPLVTVKPKFQVTIPAKLRRGLKLHEGDIMEATVLADGIFLRPKDVVDRTAVADRLATLLARIEPAPEDAGRSEDEVMADAIADIAVARRERRSGGE